jgi:hypothetical protein
MAIGKLTSLAVTGANALELTWDDGHVARVDLGEVIAGHAGLKPIRAAKAFAKAKLSKDGWSVEWPGDIDFGSPQLRRWADEQSGEAMRAEDFRRWMEEHELTLDSAASALGLSRRMVAYYLSGEKAIPKTVLLATEGWRARSRAGRKRVGVAEEGAGFVLKRQGQAIARYAATGQFIPVSPAKKRPSTSIVEQTPRSSPHRKK